MVKSDLVYVQQSTTSQTYDGTQANPYPNLTMAFAQVNTTAADIQFLDSVYAVSTTEEFLTTSQKNIVVNLM